METDAASELREVLAHYEIGELVDYEQLHLGYCNVSYIIDTVAQGQIDRYFFRKYKRGIREEELAFEHSVIQHLVGKGFDLVAGVMSTNDGKTYVKRLEDAGDAESGEEIFYAIFDFLPGEDRYTWVSPACTDQDLRGSACVLAGFHDAVCDLIPSGRRYELKIIDLLPSMAEAVQRYGQRPGATEFDVYLVENLRLIQKTIDHTVRALGTGECAEVVQQVIHCDYHPGNLKFQGGEIVSMSRFATCRGLFDFDWSKVDARCFDVALAIYYFCTAWEGSKDGALQLEEAATFLGTYQDNLRGTGGVGPLDDVELRCLPHMIQASNLYVLNWTIEDFYNSIEPDPHEYLMYLQHGVRTITWLNDAAHRDELERTIAESARPS